MAKIKTINEEKWEITNNEKKYHLRGIPVFGSFPNVNVEQLSNGTWEVTYLVRNDLLKKSFASDRITPLFLNILYRNCKQLSDGTFEITDEYGYKRCFAEDKKTLLFDGYMYQKAIQLPSKIWEVSFENGDKIYFTKNKRKLTKNN